MRLKFTYESPNHGPRKKLRPLFVVLHATGTSKVQSPLKWLCNPKSKVSAHYLVDKNGDVYKLVPTGRTAWHAGTSVGPYGKSVNQTSIGIELVNKNDGIDEYTKAQYAAVEHLLDALKAPHDIEWVATHAEIAEPVGRKTDPKGFDVERVARSAGLKVWRR